MKNILITVLITICLSCNNKSKQTLKEGSYRAILEVKDNKKLPFTFNVINENKITILNADEIIEVDEITYKNDSVYIKTPVYEGYIAAKIENNGNLNGFFIKPSLNRVVPLSTKKTTERFNIESTPKVNITGNWETVFSKNSKADKYIAKGIFKQKGNKVTGTFRTTTGDYRYLEGVINGNKLELSTFDGAHAFLFTAKVTDSIMNGYFYSGNHWKEPFTAKLNNSYELPLESELTYIKKGYDKLSFSYPDESGKLVTLKDKRFKNKVVLVQIMGTWCPNCLDETKYYVNYLKANTNKDIEVVALAFEYAKTKEKAFKSINRLKSRIGINYPILLAQFGSVDKKIAQEKLPMLNHILSYPTTIFIDKKGTVRKIHTGFNGPATGEKYIEFKEEFEKFTNKLINEN